MDGVVRGAGNGASAWVLNLDAERELEGTGHTPTSRTAARIPELARRLLGLLGPDDVALLDAAADADVRARLAQGPVAGRAWCPTPRALARLVRAGAAPVAAPSLAVLRRVNHRRFGASLAQSLPGARYVDTLDELLAVLAGPSPTGRWILKRPFGFAGRGRLRVGRSAGVALEPSARAWVLASFGRGDGLQAEPWVERAGDYAIHGFVAASGALVLGDPTAQECDDSGAWTATSRAVDLDADERASLVASGRRAGAALASAGYFGPFGVDAFRFRGEAGALRFNAQSEINARYSMGWAVGMGARRPDLDR